MEKKTRRGQIMWRKQHGRTNHSTDRNHRVTYQRYNGGYWLVGRGLSKRRRTTPLQKSEAIYFCSTNEAVRDELHCQEDLWLPTRGPALSRWPWLVKACRQQHHFIFSLVFPSHWFAKLQLSLTMSSYFWPTTYVFVSQLCPTLEKKIKDERHEKWGASYVNIWPAQINSR